MQPSRPNDPFRGTRINHLRKEAGRLPQRDVLDLQSSRTLLAIILSEFWLIDVLSNRYCRTNTGWSQLRVQQSHTISYQLALAMVCTICWRMSSANLFVSSFVSTTTDDNMVRCYREMMPNILQDSWTGTELTFLIRAAA